MSRRAEILARAKKRRASQYETVDLKTECENEGLLHISDIPFRKKQPTFRRNACNGTKKPSRDSRAKVRKSSKPDTTLDNSATTKFIKESLVDDYSIINFTRKD